MVVDETVELICELYGKRLQEITIERLVAGIFFTGVKLSNGLGGISYTPTESIHQEGGCIRVGHASQKSLLFRGTSALDILSSRDVGMLLHTVRIVVLNALSALFLVKDIYQIVEDRDALDLIDLGAVRKVAMVGAIPPFLERLKTIKDLQLHVIEKKIESFQGDDIRFYVPASEAAGLLPLCDTIIITGAAFANGTMESLLGYTGKAQNVIVAGPTAGFIPDALFARGVDIVSTVLVTEPDKALDMLAEGKGAYQLFVEKFVKKINVVNQAFQNH
jgi:uncharacterized protein (DUF4213/DUF364 family)